MEIPQLNLLLAGLIMAILGYIANILTTIKKDNRELIIKITEHETKIQKLEKNEETLFGFFNKKNHFA